MGELALSWPAMEGTCDYRVLVRHDASQRFVLDQVLVETSWTVPTEQLEPDEVHTWQVMWRAAEDESWRPLLPELPLGEPGAPDGGTDARETVGETAEPARKTTLQWRDRGDGIYRVLIRDSEPDGLLLKLPLLGTSLTVDWSRLPARRSYRWRLQTWDIPSASWQDLDSYEPLDPPQSGLRVHHREPPAAPGEPRVLLLFTVDTEANLRYIAEPDPARAIDDHIFCRHPDGDAGIEMMMETLDRHGFKGTFFLDILCEHQFGEGSLEPVVDAIKRRGHDIQLHLHTAPHLRFAADPGARALSEALTSYDADRFRAAVELALELFVERVGEEPVAYRSGAYTICDEYLEVLAERGLRIDSSIYPFKNCNVSPWMRARTQPFRVGPLLEVPVSWRIEWRRTGPVPMQFAPYRRGGDNNQSFTRIEAPSEGPPAALVYLGHSYQYLTRGPDIDPSEQQRWHRALDRNLLRVEHGGLYDVTDPPWFFAEPDASRIGLLEDNLAELAARGDVASLTLRELADRHLDTWDSRGTAVDPLPEVVDAAGRPHLTATRVYSEDFLRHLA